MSTAIQHGADVPANSGNRQLLRSLSQEHRDKYQLYVSNLVYTLAAHSLEDAFDAEGCQVVRTHLDASCLPLHNSAFPAVVMTPILLLPTCAGTHRSSLRRVQDLARLERASRFLP